MLFCQASVSVWACTIRNLAGGFPLCPTLFQWPYLIKWPSWLGLRLTLLLTAPRPLWPGLLVLLRSLTLASQLLQPQTPRAALEPPVAAPQWDPPNTTGIQLLEWLLLRVSVGMWAGNCQKCPPQDSRPARSHCGQFKEMCCLKDIFRTVK